MRSRGLLLGAGTAMLVSCGGGSDLFLPGADPSAVAVVQGDQQNGRVGAALAQPLVVLVSDASGRPLAGATVLFVAIQNGDGVAFDPDTSVTGSDGTASAQVVLGSHPGTVQGEARALGSNGAAAASAPFTLTAVSENANGIRAVSGDSQSATVGTTLADSLVVEVDDGFGNPISGVQVTWSADGGGSVSAAQTTTGDDGRTSVTRTLGPGAGTQRTLASADGLAGSPVVFVHTATSGSAQGVTVVSGNNQTGPVGAALPQPLVVGVRDAATNPVPGVAVTWVVRIGGGSVAPETSTTDGNGQASATWTMGPSAGTNTLSAVVSGIGVAEFSATAAAVGASRLSIVTQPGSSALVGVPLNPQPVIQLLDAQGNPVSQAGVEVRVSIASGGGTLEGADRKQTDGSGRAAFTNLAIRGTPGTRTLRFAADHFQSITSAPIALAAAPTTTQITQDDPDPSQSGQEVIVRFSVASASGTPGGSVQVHDGAAACSGTLSGGAGSCSLRLTETGDRTLTADYAGNSSFAPSSDTEPHHVDAAPAPPDAQQSQVTAAPDTIVAILDTSTVTATVKDASGAALAGRTVSFIASGSGGTLIPATATTGSDGVATVRFSSSDPGTATITATSDGVELSSEDIVVLPVPTSTSIIGDAPDPSLERAEVRVAFRVTAPVGLPTGEVTVESDREKSSCRAAVSAGACSLALKTRGTHVLTASYTGRDQFADSSGSTTHEVVQAGHGT